MRKIFECLFIIIITVTTSLGQSDKLLKKSYHLIDVKENYSKALVLLNKFMLEDSSNVEALWQRSVCFRRIGNYPQALNDLRNAKRIDSNNYKVYCELGTVYAMMKNVPLAEENYEKSILLNPSFYVVYNARGAIRYYYLNRKSDAFDDYSYSINLNPKSHYAYYNRGIIYRERGDYKNAIKDLTLADKIKPRDHQINYELARCYTKTKSFKDAIRSFRKALKFNNKLDPWEKINPGRLYYLRSQCYEEIGKSKRANKDEQKAIKMGYTKSYLKH